VAYEFTLHVDFVGSVSDYKAPVEGSELLITVQSLMDAEGGRASLHHAVIAALVAMHSGVRRASERMARRSARRHYVSPRDFMDLIRNFVSVVGEKRAQLEEQQLHINIGLEKLDATQSSVQALQVELGVKREELREKDALANAKLQQMIADQNEAERRKVRQSVASSRSSVGTPWLIVPWLCLSCGCTGGG
jgi:dynein heavy chain 1